MGSWYIGVGLIILSVSSAAEIVIEIVIEINIIKRCLINKMLIAFLDLEIEHGSNWKKNFLLIRMFYVAVTCTAQVTVFEMSRLTLRYPVCLIKIQ